MFNNYGLEPEVLEALSMLNYLEPTPIQEQVIPLALEGKNVVAKSQTGSGKTAAFAIPLCHMVDWDENMPQALVLEPTRELACQVRDEIFHIGRKKRLKIPAVFGGFPIDKQTLTLKQKSHVVVGTPGRVLDHLERGSLQCKKVRCLVIDEADLMLNMGFLEDVEKIMGYLPESRQTLLFSATMGTEIQALRETYFKDAVDAVVESETETVDTVIQEGRLVDNEDKTDLLLRILEEENPDNCMIFCATREMVEVLYRKLLKERIRCGMLHGLMDQKDRMHTIESFREGRFRYLVATEVAARGVDFDGITHVINYDFPTAKEAYVHRVGRTGRNGKSGKAISFINPDDRRMQEAVEEYTGAVISMEVPEYTEEELEERRKTFRRRQRERAQLKPRKGAVFQKQIMKLSIGGGRKSKMRAGDIVGAVCSVEGITVADIGIIDIRDSLTHVEILNDKGQQVLDGLQERTIKGKIRKVQKSR